MILYIINFYREFFTFDAIFMKYRTSTYSCIDLKSVDRIGHKVKRMV